MESHSPAVEPETANLQPDQAEAALPDTSSDAALAVALAAEEAEAARIQAMGGEPVLLDADTDQPQAQPPKGPAVLQDSLAGAHVMRIVTYHGRTTVACASVFQQAISSFSCPCHGSQPSSLAPSAWRP